MKTLQELGEAVVQCRKALAFVSRFAKQAGISPETLSRFEKGRCVELGARKLLALLAVLEMEIQFVEKGFSGSLDELKKERSILTSTARRKN